MNRAAREKLASFALLAVAAAAVLAAAPAARADAPRVTATGCAFAADDVARVLAVELAAIAGPDAPAPRVELDCTGANVVITVYDAVTAKRLVREVPAPAAGAPGAARAIGLATSQLLVASWVEVLVEPPRDAAPAVPAPPEPAPAVVREAVQAVVRRAVGGGREAQAGVSGGLRVHDLGDPFVAWRAGFRFAVGVGARWHVFGAADLERGAASRASGEVELRAAQVWLGAAWRAIDAGIVVVRTSAAIGGGYVRLDGQPSDPAIAGNATEGFTLDLALGIEPALRLGPLELALVAGAGWEAPTVVGVVVGEMEVTPGGPWLSAALRLSLVLDD